MKQKDNTSEQGFSIVEIIVVMILVTILSASVSMAFQNLTQTYAMTRSLNEIYAVLSSCPEIDRALQFESISGATNCFPNNIFVGEGVTAAKIEYTPALSVKTTSTLPVADSLYGIHDSKVVDVAVTRPGHPNSTWRVRLLVTRNGIGQQ